MKKLGEILITVDCDVLVADGGTRTTSITGAYVAMVQAINRLREEGVIKENPVTDGLAALSIGIDKAGDIIADLNYEEDSTCGTDMNLVMTRSGKFVEIQGTAEGEPFDREQLNQILDCAQEAFKPVFEAQDKVLK